MIVVFGWNSWDVRASHQFSSFPSLWMYIVMTISNLRRRRDTTQLLLSWVVS